MKVVVPYVELAAETQKAVLAYSDEPVVFAKLTDDEAYWRLLSGLWRELEDFAVVEQDIVIHEFVLPTFADCPKPWCTFGYPYTISPRPYHGGGCVRFRSGLMLDFPDLFEIVGTMRGRNHPRRHWCSLDGFTQVVLGKHGYKAHRHDPPVGHIYPDVSHDCNGVF